MPAAEKDLVVVAATHLRSAITEREEELARWRQALEILVDVVDSRPTLREEGHADA